MIVTLKNNEFTAKIDSKGAELLSLKDQKDIEYMWQKDPAYWGKTSPVLFPIVGNLREDKTMIDGREYQMAKHGFCRGAEFTVEEQTESQALFTYSENDETLKAYPYRFRLCLQYCLDEKGITIRYIIKNPSDQAMDFTFGAHPGFNVPLDGEGGFEDYSLEFSNPEPTPCPVFDFEKNQFDMDHRIDYLKGGNTLRLSYDYFDNDAIVFDNPVSNSVRLVSGKTRRGVEVGFGDFDFIAFWTPIKAKAPFLCIEPWCGMAACSDEDNEFSHKRGIKHLNGHEAKEFVLTIHPFSSK